MTNRILRLDVRDHSLIPASAEVHLTVVPERLDAGTKVRGRLMGPRCRFASTIEIAYHFRPIEGRTMPAPGREVSSPDKSGSETRREPHPSGGRSLTLRALLPEASLWEPETPHLYLGPVELWQDGNRVEVVEVRHGLRSLAIGPRGLRINGKLIALRGRQVESLSDQEALALRYAGVNLLVAPARDSSRHVWEVADRVGFLVVGSSQPVPAEKPGSDLAAHASFLGWLGPGGEFLLAGDELRSHVGVIGVVER